MGDEAVEKDMDDSCKAFYISLAEGRPGAMLSSVNRMKELMDKMKTSEDHPAWAEMVAECERKGGEACLSLIRSVCKDGRERLITRTPDDDNDDTQEEAQLRRDKLAGACFAAVGLDQKRGVISIYGGYLQALLKSKTDRIFSILSKKRAVRRLNRVGVKSSEQTDADPHPHATVITEVLSFTCTILEDHLLGKGLGPDVELAIAGQLHDDCCYKTTKILGWMHEDCGVDWWCDQAKNAEGGGSNKQDVTASPIKPSSSTFDTQDLDFVVDELSFVCQVVQRYIEFVEARNCLSMNSEASQGLLQSFHCSVGSYVALEDSYCLLSVKEAVKIAEPIEGKAAPSIFFILSSKIGGAIAKLNPYLAPLLLLDYYKVKKGVLVSSMVEDAAFLLLKSLERSVSTHSTQAIMATVNRIADILDPLAPQPSFFSGLQSESVYLTTTFPHNSGLEEQRYKENEKETFGEAFARALEEDMEGVAPTTAHTNQSEIVIMNSSQAAVNATTALQNAVLRHLDGENALTQTLIEQMRAAMRAYEELRDGYVKSFISRTYPRAAKICQISWIDSGGISRYRMNVDAYEAAVAAEDFPWAKSLIDAIQQGPLGVCRDVMMKETFECLLQELARDICADVEHFILGTAEKPNSKCITEWGALVLQREERMNNEYISRMYYPHMRAPLLSHPPQVVFNNDLSPPLLQKQVRMLQGQLVGMVEEGASSLADSFERLNFIILLLTVESPSDLIHYTNQSQALSPTTSKCTLFLREEFDPGTVHALLHNEVFSNISSEQPPCE